MNQATRDAVREGAKRSASIILPLIFDTLGTPNYMLDVGSGEGWWCAAAEELGVSAVGVDADPTGAIPWDAEQSTPLPERDKRQRWPLALCLETAEHLTPAAGDHLVAELCRVSTEIIWSAAIPGQGGDGHINEQWPGYWQDRFLEHGYWLTDPWRDALWQHEFVEPWYRQNLLLAVPVSDDDPLRVDPRALVDPVTWAHHRGVPAP